LLTTAVRLQTSAKERRPGTAIASDRNPFGDRTMRRIHPLALALGVALATPSHAQTSNTIRLNDASGTTTLSPPHLSGPLDVDPDAMQTPADKDNGARPKAPARTAPSPAPPPAEVREDPRTMITRDRVESPQH
jgi:hypothetical protein